MARTRSISDERILDAAREVFLAKGYTATTAEIARRAGISEGTIFRRFPSKQVLFVRAMELDAPLPWMELADELPGVGEPRANLRRLLTEIHGFFVDHVPRMIGLISSPVDICGLFGDGGDDTRPIRGHKALAGYLAREAELGRIDLPLAPMVAARIAIGALHLSAFGALTKINDRLELRVDEVIDGVVTLLLGPTRDSAEDDVPRAAANDDTPTPPTDADGPASDPASAESETDGGAQRHA